MIEAIVVGVATGTAIAAGVNTFAAYQKMKAEIEELRVRALTHGLEIVVRRDDKPINLHELDPQFEAEIKSQVERVIEIREAKSGGATVPFSEETAEDSSSHGP